MAIRCKATKILFVFGVAVLKKVFKLDWETFLDCLKTFLNFFTFL